MSEAAAHKEEQLLEPRPKKRVYPPVKDTEWKVGDFARGESEDGTVGIGMVVEVTENGNIVVETDEELWPAIEK